MGGTNEDIPGPETPKVPEVPAYIPPAEAPAPEEPSAQEPPPKPAKKVPFSAMLQKEVKGFADASKIRAEVISKLGEKEIDRRSTAVYKILEMIEANEASRNKIRPKVTGFILDLETGAKKPSGPPVFDEAQAAEMEKLIKEYGKLQHALELAFGETSDFSKVFELANNAKK